MLHPSPTCNCPQDNSEGTYLGPVFENASITQTCLCTPSGNGTQSCHPTPTLQNIPKNHSCAQPLHALNSAINKLKKCNKIQYFLQNTVFLTITFKCNMWIKVITGVCAVILIWFFHSICGNDLQWEFSLLCHVFHWKIWKLVWRITTIRLVAIPSCNVPICLLNGHLNGNFVIPIDIFSLRLPLPCFLLRCCSLDAADQIICLISHCSLLDCMVRLWRSHCWML